jgi:hypothetical protein
MAASPQVSGPCEIKLDTGASRALQSLGWTANGAQITRTALRLDIPGDQNGGDDGVPIEIQDFGGLYRVRLEMTKWDTTVEAAVRKLGNPNGTGGYSSTAVGSVNTPGTLMIANGAYYRLLLLPTDTSRAVNFLAGILREDPYELNLSSKHSRLILNFTCYPLNGVIWNTTTT